MGSGREAAVPGPDRDGPRAGRPVTPPAVIPARGPGQPARLLALQRQAGNRAVCALVQRQFTVEPPSGGPTDLRTLLADKERFGLAKPSDLRSWYNTRVKGSLVGQFGFQRFVGYLNHASPEYSMSTPVSKDPAALTYDDLTAAVVRGINNHIVAKKVQTGHSSLGNVKLMKRDGFPAAIKKSYDKSPVIKELAANYGTKQIHLRHFVMGSWFRALPDAVAKADLDTAGRQGLAKQVSGLITLLGPWAGQPSAGSTGEPDTDVKLLASLLHDLLPNLNAGAGPENTIIGFMSNGLSNLATDVSKDGIILARDDVDELVEAAVDGVNIVTVEERQAFRAKVDPGGVFTAIVDQHARDADPLSPEVLAAALHDFAFQLGMDFMKHEVGRAQQLSKTSIAVLQALMLPLGQTMYGLILAAQKGPVNAIDLAKFFNALERAANSMAAALKQ